MRSHASGPFASPATLLAHLLDTGRSPAELNWRLGTTSEPGRSFVAAECDLDREIVLDPRGWPNDVDLLSALWVAAADEWAAGAPRPAALLQEQWNLQSGAEPLDDDVLQRLLPLLPRLRGAPLSAHQMGQLFALLTQQDVAGINLALDVPINPPDGMILGHTAPLADAVLRLRVLDVEAECVDRLVAAGWVAPGPGPLPKPGWAGQAVLDLLPHHWLLVELELVPLDRRLVLGRVVLGDTAVLAGEPAWSRT